MVYKRKTSNQVHKYKNQNTLRNCQVSFRLVQIRVRRKSAGTGSDTVKCTDFVSAPSGFYSGFIISTQ